MPNQLPYENLDLIPYGGAVSSAIANLPTSQNKVNSVYIYDWVQILESSIAQYWEDSGTYAEGNIRADGTGALYRSLKSSNSEPLTDTAWWVDLSTNASNVGGGFINIDTDVDYTASNREIVYCDTLHGTIPATTKFTVTLPDNPTEGYIVVVRDKKNSGVYANIDVITNTSLFSDTATGYRTLTYKSFDVVFYFDGQMWDTVNELSWIKKELDTKQSATTPSYIQIPDATAGYNSTHVIDYALGSYQRVTVSTSGTNHFEFTNFVADKMCHFILDIITLDIVPQISFPDGVLFADGVMPILQNNAEQKVHIMSTASGDIHIYTEAYNMSAYEYQTPLSVLTPATGTGNVYSQDYHAQYSYQIGEISGVKNLIVVDNSNTVSVVTDTLVLAGTYSRTPVYYKDHVYYIDSSTTVFNHVDVSDPANLVAGTAGTLPLESSLYGLGCYRDRAFVMTGINRGVMIMDISNPNSISHVNTITLPGTDNFMSSGYIGFKNNLMFIAHDTDILVYDISNIDTPVFLSSDTIPYGIDVFVITDTMLYCVAGGVKIYTLEISDPHNMRYASEVTIDIDGSGQITDMMFLNGRLFASNWGNERLIEIDISNPSNPRKRRVLYWVEDNVGPRNLSVYRDRIQGTPITGESFTLTLEYK